MGRDLSWYIIPSNIEHDHSKRLCMNYECEPEEFDVERDIYEKIKIDNDCNCNSRQYFKKIKDTTIEYKSNAIHWCPLCLMYVNGIYDFPDIIAKEHIHHSYRNPIWESMWNVQSLYMGNGNTEFVNKFSDRKNYREISSKDIDCAFHEIESFGKPSRTYDIEAYDETMTILHFLRKYCKPEYRIIMDDEI